MSHQLEQKLSELRQEQDEVRSRLRDLVDPERDALSDEEAGEFDRLNERDDELVEAIRSVEETRREQRRQEIRDAVSDGKFTTGAAVPSAPHINVRTDPWDMTGVPAYGQARNREVRARALAAIEKSSRFIADAHKERASELLQRVGHQEDHFAEYLLLGSSEDYADGFLRKMVGDDVDTRQAAALAQRRDLARAMSLTDVTGVLVPTHLDPSLIIANDGRTNPFRRVCRVETGTTNVYQSVRTSGVTHDWTAEANEVGDNAPSFENPTATAYKGTVFVPISFEAFEDARGRESEILQLFADEIDDAEALVFVSGNGTNRPRGLITALDANTNAEVANGTSNEFHLADVYNVYESLPPRYRNDRTVWFANLSVINDIRQFGDETFHSQTVQLGARTVPAILGHGVLEASNMDSAITAAATNNLLAVGDPSTYLIYDRLGMSVELVPNLFHADNHRPSGQRGWLAHHRVGANLTVGHAAADSVVGFRLLQTESN